MYETNPERPSTRIPARRPPPQHRRRVDAAHGIRVLRFTNLEVLAEVDAVFVKIRRALGDVE
jgi:very-short-patch-repair endonuclease